MTERESIGETVVSERRSYCIVVSERCSECYSK